ncbi:BREX system Lon protease-like protein BrxL [Aliiglaciecola sp. 2_MG-2023]|uniref:BREX system Lon protease-like protein BrxL n=1 Tax=unclassified Aliiglaciecola TaxID=2593648 RepID=UPI0026E2BD3D|nr:MULTISPECIES: BREX system Lon protease-like protein BrxL [unclassified Aliiglaciecola]MDO6710338.1 BREX system Lon protease-like protein BrxL [Aliiglaciecola sp. 2_MG-2023]MDO6751485.1 BREX system Lon protease-like protein BrxL [Aliiglaciecola sp. 1_MG-2023]
MDKLDQKLIEIFDGKLVRKDLLQRIKKGTNVPTFVLEFLLARYCASDDEDEIQAGLEAVLETLSDNYVRPDEANAAQSKVATKGRHKFIDKVHVRYVETKRRHWASLENFNSQKIAVGEKFYKENKRLLEGGIWAEVKLAYNDVEEDDYAFYIEDLRPIQLSRFDFNDYKAGRALMTRDEWMDVILRSVGLEPSKLKERVKLHFLMRLAPLVEANFNFIELGPRGTGKSYFYSEFSPYSTLISGGQATVATLFYNKNRKETGLVGHWDTLAFDEVGNMKVKDPDVIQILKDFMANGRFSRGKEVIADASTAFVGNLDLSVKQVVNSTEYDLFQPLPKEFDLAVLDRFYAYLPGWEMPKNSSEFLTSNYGFITDYLAEAFHHQLKSVNVYEMVNKRIKLGKAIEGRDEKGIKKTVCAFIKMLHPHGECNDEEFEQYVEYAVESRRRVKEQMNKRKPDDEFANIDLSYINAKGEEIIVRCPETIGALATLEPSKPSLVDDEDVESEKAESKVVTPAETVIASQAKVVVDEKQELKEQHYKINYGATGYSYESIILPYLLAAKSIVIEDPYIRAKHQLNNFVRFCEAVIKQPSVEAITLITSYDDDTNIQDMAESLDALKQSLLEMDVKLDVKVNENLHDREIRIDNGWTVKIGRGLDFYQKPDSWFGVGVNDLSLRKCLETSIDIFKH